MRAIVVDDRGGLAVAIGRGQLNPAGAVPGRGGFHRAHRALDERGKDAAAGAAWTRWGCGPHPAPRRRGASPTPMPKRMASDPTSRTKTGRPAPRQHHAAGSIHSPRISLIPLHANVAETESLAIISEQGDTRTQHDQVSGRGCIFAVGGRRGTQRRRSRGSGIDGTELSGGLRRGAGPGGGGSAEAAQLYRRLQAADSA